MIAIKADCRNRQQMKGDKLARKKIPSLGKFGTPVREYFLHFQLLSVSIDKTLLSSDLFPW